MSDTPTLDDLARLFGFTPDECVLNRTGQFSNRQRQTLIYRSIGYLVRGVALSVLCLVLAAYLTTLIHRQVEWVLFSGLIALILVVVFLLARAIYQLIARPTIHALTGPLCRAGDANHPLILAGNTPLRVSFRRWKRLATTYPGLYTFYIGPGNMLLSLEPIREANEF